MGCKIMIADDSTFMRDYERRILEGAGFEIVAEASNGEDAIIKYKQYEPDIVLMDTVMNEVDGLAALKNIMVLYPDAKIILCSSMGQRGFIADAVTEGAKAFLVKPFQSDVLVKAINRIRIDSLESI